MIIAGGASASITAIMSFGVHTIATDFEAAAILLLEMVHHGL